ncbi:MAG TPA: PIN domain-containing protein, partial [Promineifilum sp.]
MRYLLDTSALLAHYREEIGWEVVQGLFEDLESDIMIPSPSLAEFARRLLALGVDDAEIAAVLDNYGLLFTAVVAIDAPVALAAY